jgi:fumarate reductase (CoM/CoB) subunit A
MQGVVSDKKGASGFAERKSFDWQGVLQMCKGFVHLQCEVLVIGSGAAGMMAAIQAAERGCSVLLATKGPLRSSCSSMARGGYTVVLGDTEPGDNTEIHYNDMLRAGYGLSGPSLARTMVEDIVRVTYQMDNWGINLVKENGVFARKARPGHSYPRTVHYYDSTGKAVMDCLTRKLKSLDVKVLSNTMVGDLITVGGRVAGAWAVQYPGENVLVIGCKAVILAAGGAGRLYNDTDNPLPITGDGYGIAYRSGAELTDMEMIEFQLMVCYPEKLTRVPPNAGSFLANGARLYNGNGERFIKKQYNQLENEVSRSKTSRAVAIEIYGGRATESGGVWLDASDVYDVMLSMNPGVMERFSAAGVDLRYQPMNLKLGAHTFLGGVVIESDTSTAVPGLFACGEVAGGIHGANRLPGAALADALAFGYRAGVEVTGRVKDDTEGQAAGLLIEKAAERVDECRRMLADAPHVKKRVKDIMSSRVMIVRSREILQNVQDELFSLERELTGSCRPSCNNCQGAPVYRLKDVLETQNLLQLAGVIVLAALTREESRGCHYRLDFPEQDDVNWRKNIVIRLVAGRPEAVTRAPEGYC